jgi:hypothetical protein
MLYGTSTSPEAIAKVSPIPCSFVVTLVSYLDNQWEMLETAVVYFTGDDLQGIIPVYWSKGG